MINQVVVGCRSFIFLIVNPERRSSRGNRLWRPGQAEECGVKMREILGHSGRRIALWVHGDHEELYFLCLLRFQSLQGLRDLCQSRWAYAWAKGVSKVEQD